MAITISNAYIQTYEATVRHLAQQMETKLRGTVMERGSGGEKHNWDRLGATEAAQKTSARTPTPTADMPWSRRVSIAQTWHHGETVEPEDVVQMLIDPKSSVATSQAMAMRRAIDNLIITAATGDATIGDGTTVAFPASQRVGDGTTPISFDFITQVQRKFMDNDIDPAVPKVAVVGPGQVETLMKLTEQTSSDYVGVRSRGALQELQASGIAPNWMGFTWIMSTLLQEPAGGQLDCLFYTNRAIGMQVNKDITSRVAEDPSLSFAWRIYSMLTMGAVRVEDEHIVNLRVSNA